MPCCPIFAVTQNEKTFRQLALVNNVFPILVKEDLTIRQIVGKGIEIAKQNKYINDNDVVAIAGGGTVLDGFDSSDMNRTMGGIVRV